MTETGSLSLEAVALRERYATGTLSPLTVAETVLARIEASADDHVWISRASREAVLNAAQALEQAQRAGQIESLPLFGLPFAVKDNIDVAGMTTTAGCPGFAYVPDNSAPVVERLLAAGALFIGKTNLDQFATGLSGLRSPYGVPVNPFDRAYIPGGSSSGSGVAVARGLVSFAVTTDTAGSGRVPAAFTNTVGLKPTRGLIGNSGVVPSCRSLDGVAILALTVGDAQTVLASVAGFDAADAYARRSPLGWRVRREFPAGVRFAIPESGMLVACEDADAERLWQASVARLAALGGTPVRADISPFRDAASLLLSGPWLAERTTMLRPFLEARPEAVHPVIRTVLKSGERFSARDVFHALHTRETLCRRAEAVWAIADVLLLPTVPTAVRVEAMEAAPITLNHMLGSYVAGVNLLDLCAVSVPAGFRNDGMPLGVQVIAPAWQEDLAMAVAAALHTAARLPLGATGVTGATMS